MNILHLDQITKFKAIFFLSLFFSLQLFSQSWDYINFQSATDNSNHQVLGATIDDNNTVYAFQQTTQFPQTKLIRKYINGVAQTTTSTNFPTSFNAGSNIGANFITSGSNHIYVVGEGTIYKIDHSLSSTTNIRQITATNGAVKVYSVEYYNNELYISGFVYKNNNSSQATFNFGGSYSAVNITQSEAFIAKYSTTGNCILFKTIGVSGGNRATDLNVDYTGNMYATYISTTTNVRVLKRFDSSGNFDSAWGTKQNTIVSGDHCDIKIDPDGNAIYHVINKYPNNLIEKYETSSTGNLLLTKSVRGSHSITQIALNNCGILSATGISQPSTSVSRATPQGSFFSISSDKNIGGITHLWAANANGQGSIGVATLPDSNGKFNIMAKYNGRSITINGQQTHTSPTYTGLNGKIFIARVDDINSFTNAKASASFVNPDRIIQKNSKYGPGDVAILCLSDDLLVNGSISTCANRYFIGLSEFDLNAWTEITPLHSDWVQPLQSPPNNIKITDFLPQGYQLRPNIVYKFRLAVGMPWDSVDLFFMIECC